MNVRGKRSRLQLDVYKYSRVGTNLKTRWTERSCARCEPRVSNDNLPFADRHLPD
jgi:hypothetical protein